MKATTKRKAIDKAGPATGPAAPSMPGLQLDPATVQPLVRNVLAERAMLVSLTVRVWTARKLDKKITAETNAAHGAKPDAGRYNKALISKSALAEIAKIAGQARTLLYTETLPWCNDGMRIMSGANYLNFTSKFRGLRQLFEIEADKFAEFYPDLQVQAQADLNGMYDQNDYPAASTIRAKFSFDVNLFPVPDASDFRLDMATGQVAEIKSAIERQLSDAMAIAQKDVWSRMLDKVGHMAKKLREHKPAEFDIKTGDITRKAEGIFRDSLVDNVRELADLMPTLNITGNADLDAMAKRLIADLCDTSAEDLRLDEMVRNQTAEKAEAILADIEGFLA